MEIYLVVESYQDMEKNLMSVIILIRDVMSKGSQPQKGCVLHNSLHMT